jgi:NADH-quinone oxidoreductase subunit J
VTPFHVAAAVAVVATALAITRIDAVAALLYLNVSLLAVGVVFLLIGAPFAAALEALVYAGAIVVLFVFVIMLFNVAHWSEGEERAWLRGGAWAGPAVLALVLAGELLAVLAAGDGAPPRPAGSIEPQQVGAALFATYPIGVELVALLLLAALVGAYHIGHRRLPPHGKGEP